MAKVYEKIDHQIRAWLLKQPLFFVASAPLAADGRVNVSPKGMEGTFAVLGEHRVAYLDYTGSGAETIAHLRENGRITFMFCSFAGRPKIVRLHGTGRFVLPGDPEFASLRRHFSKESTGGQRAVVVADIERVSDACGWSVPLMDHRADRTTLDRVFAERDQEYLDTYWQTTNGASIDGLPALRGAAEVAPPSEEVR
ncbi:pyridoxamine 5'-phosphate oxidase family protein [Streptomyces sp. BBFR2]|uniref:pyridoxamine 5'-phosphate oxidase family protein n=1 Tax=Streptomyces sp. BBFR2 TaxID=3372854 RepID=UPI0037D9C522